MSVQEMGLIVHFDYKSTNFERLRIKKGWLCNMIEIN